MYINYKYKNPIFKNRNGFMIGGGVYNQSGGSNFFRAFERCVGLDCGEETPGQVDTPIHMNRPDRGEFFYDSIF